jgi:hypothetical protein
MKHKQRRAWISSISAGVGVLLSTVTVADCIVEKPAVQANVVVRECLGVTFEASASKVELSNGRYEAERVVAKVGSLSGTLLSVDVSSSNARPVSSGPDRDKSRIWAAGQRVTVFVSEPNAKVCPPLLHGKATVTETLYCCDPTDRSGLCILPRGVIPVSISHVTR